MATACTHEAIYQLKIHDVPETEELCRRQAACPDCQKLLEVHFIKTVPMVDDAELSPEWCANGFKEI